METAAGAEETVDWETAVGAEDMAGSEDVAGASATEEAAASEETASDSGFSASLLTGAELTASELVSLEETTSELTGAELTISLEVTSELIAAAVFELLHPPKETATMSRAITAMSFFFFMYFMENPPDDRPWR